MEERVIYSKSNKKIGIDLLESLQLIQHSEFYIGLNSGMAWLSHALGKKVVMISNFSEDWNEFDLSLDGITILNPFGFLDFLQLEANARLVLTDSGGVQEETCVLGVPCVTVRENTERPETLEVGSNILAGVTSSGILDAVERMLLRGKSWSNPFGNGDTGKAILKILKEEEV